MTLLDTWDDPAAVPQAAAAGAAVVRLPLLDELLLQWPHVAGLLHRATVRTGCYEPIDLLKLAMEGQVGIWFCEVEGAVEAAIVTEVKVYPRRRVLEILFAGGGGMRHWRHAMVETLDAHARQTGCSHVAGIGRPGWARVWGGEATGDIVVVRGLRT